MADRTTSTVFYPSTDPTILRGKTNASDNDTFTIPYGQLKDCMVSSQDDNDAIVSADTSGSVVTLGCIDDAGATVSVDFDILFECIIRVQ